MLARIKSMIVLCCILSLWEIKFFSRNDNVKWLLLLQQGCFVYIFIGRALTVMSSYSNWYWGVHTVRKKWIRFDCGSHVLIEPLLQTNLLAATNSPNCIVQTSYIAWAEGKFKLWRKTHIFEHILYTALNFKLQWPTKSVLGQFWRPMNSCWAGNYAGPKHSPAAEGTYFY